jgi:transposase
MTAAAAPTKKKSLHASERETERVQTLRATFREPVATLDARRLQCVDASGGTLAMTRRYGRATPGQRVGDHVPNNYGTNQTMLAAWGLEGLHASWGVDGAVHGDIFRYWVRHVLGPTLQPGDMVLWENLSAHKVAGIEALITARGARLLPWSPYAPDCNPIARWWSKIKTYVRRAKARTMDALLDAIKQALDTVTTADIPGWFAHCGYPIH